LPPKWKLQSTLEQRKPVVKKKRFGKVADEKEVASCSKTKEPVKERQKRTKTWLRQEKKKQLKRDLYSGIKIVELPDRLLVVSKFNKPKRKFIL
jgi:hypothetical protein